MGTSHRLIEVRHSRTTVPAFGKVPYWRKLQRLQQTKCLAFWPLAEASGTICYDRSIHTTAVNGTYPATGVTFGQAGPDGGKCIQLAGTGYANIFNANLVTRFRGEAGTAAIWFKIGAAEVWADGANRQILQLRADSNNLVRFYKSTASNQLVLQYIAAGTQETFLLYLAATQWTHLALTWDAAADQVKAYVNGRQVGTTATALGTWAGTLTNGNMYLGATSNTPGNPWIGWLAYGQLFGDALAPIDILRMVYPFERLFPERGVSQNAAAPLETPTSDELGTACHPDIVYVAAGWNGYKYWLVISPYPGEARENPEILASNDGDTWVVPEGLTNPIDPTPVSNYNSDPDLILGQDNCLYCFYREYNPGDSTAAIKVRSSADGVTWGAEAEAIASPSGAWSPAVVWDGAQYVMYYVAANQTPRRIERRTAAAPAGPWSAAVICPINYPMGYPNGKEPWHLDVFWDEDRSRWVGLFTMVNQGVTEYSSAKLYLGFSEDGFVWKIAENPVLYNTQGWDSNRIYRSTGLPKAGGGYDVWYSALDNASAWRIGRTVITGV